MHPRYHLIPLFVLFIAVTIASVSAADDERYLNCSAPFHCGNRQDIGYPFWGLGRAAYCGHPGFELTSCSTPNPPEIKIKDLRYQVLNMNETPRTITVLRTDYSQNLCPDLLHNTSLDDNFTYTNETQNITLHYNCTTPMPQALSGLQFNCSLNGSTTILNFFATTALAAEPPPTAVNSLGSCKHKVDVSVNGSETQALTQAPSGELLLTALGKGFGLQWDTNMDRMCSECESSGGQCGYNGTTSEFSCFCKDEAYPFACGRISASPSPESTPNSKSGTFTKRLTIIIGITSTIGLFILVSIVATYFKRRELSSVLGMIIWRKNSKCNEKIEAFMSNHSFHAPQRYSYSEVKRMTNSFTTKLGQGGFGSVYKGKLLDGRLVAVKMLDKSKADGEEFINEVASISRTNHINVVTMLGFCYDGRYRALIYEYMPNGSLDKLIFYRRIDRSKRSTHQLEWKVLFEIAVGIAKGLEYLHSGCNIRIVHFDIKPHNILLDEDFCPKISDFGLAKLRNRNESMVSLTGAKGTIGYIAPEIVFRSYGGVSSKSDVYSYGIMILEMVGGRRTREIDDEGCSNSSEIYFPDQFYKYFKLEDFSTIYGALTNDEENVARKMILVGLWCIQTNPSSRPSMVKVVDMLEGSLESLQIPPKPYLYPPTILIQEKSTMASSTRYTESEMDEQMISIM